MSLQRDPHFERLIRATLEGVAASRRCGGGGTPGPRPSREGATDCSHPSIPISVTVLSPADTVQLMRFLDGAQEALRSGSADVAETEIGAAADLVREVRS